MLKFFKRRPSLADRARDVANRYASKPEALTDSAALARAVASHVLRRGANELAAPDSFDSFRD